MTERPTPIGTVAPAARHLEPMNRLSVRSSESFPDLPHLSPPFDVPQAILTRPTPELTREAAQPLAQERAARRFHAWLHDASHRPHFAIAPVPNRPAALAAALACPDLFLIETPLGQDRLNAIIALVEGARESGQRLAILTANPDNANAIVLALPAVGVGRAMAEYEGELPPVVAEQSARMLALGEWRSRRSILLAQHQETARQLKWWGEWARIAEAESRLAEDAALLATRSEEAAQACPEVKAAAEHLAGLVPVCERATAADAETRRVLETQLAEWRNAAIASRGGFMKKFFGGAKSDPGLAEQIAAAEAKLRELDTAAGERTLRLAEAEKRSGEIRRARIAEDFSRLQTSHDERAVRWNRDRDAANTTRPSASREHLQMTLADLEAKLADTQDPPATPHREAIQKLAVVIGPLASLDSCPFFAPTHPEAAPPFDRVLFADGEELHSADVIRAARLAAAWTILGSTNLPRPAYRNGKPGRGEFFRETFDAVAACPWRSEEGRIVVSLAKADPRTLRSEPLADNPKIELRFNPAELAEVAFPPSYGLADVKRFCFAELGVAKAQFLGAPEWTATAEAIVCNWPGLAAGPSFDLGSGIRESLAGADTAHFRFDTAAGWTRDTAEEWFRDHFGAQPITRAARLVSQR